MNHHLRTMILLEQQNFLMTAQNRAMLQAMASPVICKTCNGVIIPTDEEKQLLLENALLVSELETIKRFHARLNLCRSLFPSAASSSTWLYAVAAMAPLSLVEVLSLARLEAPMWTGARLDLDEYYSRFFPWYARNAPGFVHEASKASAMVASDASSLVTILMDPGRWPHIFPSMIAAGSIESQHQGFQVINMDFMPLITPFIQNRNVKLLRCSKRIDNNTWVIADMSVYFSSYAPSRPNFMRFPSGYLVKHKAIGVSEVTIIDHWVYEEEQVTNPFRPYLGNPYSGFGAHRCLAALQRHCYESWFNSIPSMGHNIQLMTDPIRQANLLNLSKLMVYLFCTGACGITGQNWNRLRTVIEPVNNIRMFTRESRDMRGVPCVLVSATGFARINGRPESIFRLINRARKRDIWNYLASYGDMREVIRLQRSNHPGNEVSVFSIERTGYTDWCLIQETHYEASSAMIIHSCVEASSLVAVINGGDLSRVQLLPCGLTIMPYGLEGSVVLPGCQVMADQAMVTNSVELEKYLEMMVTDILIKVQNALPMNLNLP